LHPLQEGSARRRRQSWNAWECLPADVPSPLRSLDSIPPGNLRLGRGNHSFLWYRIALTPGFLPLQSGL